MAGLKFHRRTRNRLGQTLIEATVACGIVATAVAAALTMVISSINAEKESEMSIVAANLGREGVEVARAIRDTNWLQEREWDDGLVGAGGDHTAVPVFDPDAGVWTMDFDAGSLTDDYSKVYRFVMGDHFGLMAQAEDAPSDAAVTLFRRLLYIDSICEDDTVMTEGLFCSGKTVGVQVTARVAWSTGPRQRSMDIVGRLYDWY
jgi:hypothetical protein